MQDDWVMLYCSAGTGSSKQAVNALGCHPLADEDILKDLVGYQGLGLCTDVAPQAWSVHAGSQKAAPSL